MSNISTVLFTAKESLLSHLTAINVTGSNISNVNTDGYSRLQPIFETVGTKDALSNQMQDGVKIADVERVYDKFLISQLVQQQSGTGSSQAQNDLLTQIENVLNESAGGGINDALDKFWNAWGDLSSNPSGQAQRDVLVSSAQNLTSVFRQRISDLTNIQNDVNDNISDTISTLNGYITNLASYNDEIIKAEIGGGHANDLRDKRDSLLQKISSIIDINYIEKNDGSDYVFLTQNGKALVEGSNYWKLAVKNNNAKHSYDVVFANDPTKVISDSITGGKLAGLLQVRDATIPAYVDELNQTATSIINKVNGQHMQGYDQDGNIGGYFFTPTDEAKDMEVSSEIINNTRKIAASATVNNDGDNAQAIIALKDDNMFASLGTINPRPAASSSVVGSGTGLTADDHIILTRGATAGTWTVTTHANYAGMVVTAATADSVTISADGTNNAITLSLSGTWEPGDTAAFDITAAGPTVSAVTVTDVGNNTATGVINNVGQVYKNTTTDHPILLTHGATSAASDWTVTDNGGYSALRVLSADDNSVTLDLNGNGTNDITINLSGTWQQNENLSFALTKNDDTTTVGGYYNAFISKVGQDVNSSSQEKDRQNTILNQFTDQRNQLSGVSLDEEMLNLVKYQMGYNAAGRLCSVVQDMMSTLINLGVSTTIT